MFYDPLQDPPILNFKESFRGIVLLDQPSTAQLVGTSTCVFGPSQSWFHANQAIING